MSKSKEGLDWFKQQGWKAHKFQKDTWKAYLNGHSGLVNAPTGSGKTYSLFIPIVQEYINNKNKPVGIKAIWITPIKALAKEIRYACQRLCDDLGLEWNVAIRTGDTSQSERAKLKRKPPDVLITTPESLHLHLASKGYRNYFKNLSCIVIDEWHELIGSKRGVQIELALSRIKSFLPNLKLWGISATIGNMEEAVKVLRGHHFPEKEFTIIKSKIKKKIVVETLLPDVIEKFPWAGHLGLSMLKKVLPVIMASKTTLIFTNTRAQAEIWYQNLLLLEPELAGVIAMHHGSINKELRAWVEQSLHEEKLKAVVCTSSLDLGVDFRPVETIIQIGSPKGVARFIQRAGRSGHQPGAVSKIYFVPTHSLELIEAAALRKAIKDHVMESRIPYFRSFDVLVQYLVTLAVSDGFDPEKVYREIKQTFSFESINSEEWNWCLQFITSGGAALEAYDEYSKVIIEAGLYKVIDRRTSMRHRLSIGTIVSDVSMIIKYVSGKRIGTVEEWFISQLKPGDNFWFAGRSLELVRVKGITAQVRKSKSKKGKIPSWQGGRMSFSSELSAMLRYKIDEAISGKFKDPELKSIYPLIELQAELSHVPNQDEFLIEYFKSNEGYHLLFYPFDGRYVHEGMGALLAWRIARIKRMSFSIAMNDYGFELLSDVEIPIEQALEDGLFNTKDLGRHIEESINSVEMARRKFRDIAGIAGLVFKGYPGKEKKDKHLQSSSQLFFEVFTDYEPDNLLLIEAYDEVMNFQLQEARLRATLERINTRKIVLAKPERATPFSFPIMVDRMREKMSNESLEDRIKKMTLR